MSNTGRNEERKSNGTQKAKKRESNESDAKNLIKGLIGGKKQLPPDDDLNDSLNSQEKQNVFRDDPIADELESKNRFEARQEPQESNKKLVRGEKRDTKSSFSTFQQKLEPKQPEFEVSLKHHQEIALNHPHMNLANHEPNYPIEDRKLTNFKEAGKEMASLESNNMLFDKEDKESIRSNPEDQKPALIEVERKYDSVKADSRKNSKHHLHSGKNVMKVVDPIDIPVEVHIHNLETKQGQHSSSKRKTESFRRKNTTGLPEVREEQTISGFNTSEIADSITKNHANRDTFSNKNSNLPDDSRNRPSDLQ